MPTISDLPILLQQMPNDLRPIADVFAVAIATGTLELPTHMQQWTIEQFGSLAAVERQTIVKIVNQQTLEGALFGLARASRPAGRRSNDTALEAWIAAELADDIFAKPLQTTPADRFGRIQGRFCLTASNIAKYDGWHGVVIFNESHPLHFNREQVVDYLETAWCWIEAAHSDDPQAVYPIITWNCLPKSGASLAHGHMQVALGSTIPYSQVERWRQAAVYYQQQHRRNYFADLAALHHEVGLGLAPHNQVGRFLHLTPARNHEVVLFDRQPWATHGPHVFAEALYETLATLIQGGTRAFNVAIACPPLSDDQHDWQAMPVIARIGDRGDPLTVRSDIGVMELYGTPVITADPFETAKRFTASKA